MDLVKIPEGQYSKLKIDNREVHTIMFHLKTRTFTISADSMDVLNRMVIEFFCPDNRFKTVVEYNKAVLNSFEDTVSINMEDFENMVQNEMKKQDEIMNQLLKAV